MLAISLRGADTPVGIATDRAWGRGRRIDSAKFERNLPELPTVPAGPYQRRFPRTRGPSSPTVCALYTVDDRVAEPLTLGSRTLIVFGPWFLKELTLFSWILEIRGLRRTYPECRVAIEKLSE